MIKILQDFILLCDFRVERKIRLNRYFNIKKWLGKIKIELIKLNFRLGRSIITRTKALDQNILFTSSNEIEYFLRAKSSYFREKITMYWIENVIKEEDVVFDIGANVGAYSLMISKLMEAKQGKGCVYAFEPESQNFASLNKNIMLNKLSGYILPFCIALGDKLKAGNFYLSSPLVGSALHGLDRPFSDGVSFTPKHQQGIIAISLDEFVRLKDVRFPNHIKIDVDGIESVIVENMRSLLNDHRLKTICMEINSDLDKKKIKKLMNDYGFNIMQEEKLGNKQSFNFLFVRG